MEKSNRVLGRPTAEEFKEGQARLREYLIEAKAQMALEEVELVYRSNTGIGAAQAQYLNEDNLDSLVIYEARLGGFHVDLILKEVPDGVANTLGTAVGSPCKTREEAEEIGRRLLLGALVLSQKADDVVKKNPVFLLHGWEIELRPEVFEALRYAGVGRQGFMPSQVVDGIEIVLAEVCPDGFDGRKFSQLRGEQKAHLLTVLHLAALSGVFIYPVREDRPPGGDENVSRSN